MSEKLKVTLPEIVSHGVKLASLVEVDTCPLIKGRSNAMDPEDNMTPDSQGWSPLTTDDVERIADPLTVVQGYTHLLLRRLRRGQVIDEAELIRVLELIAAGSRTVATGLTALAAKSRATGGRPKDH